MYFAYGFPQSLAAGTIRDQERFVDAIATEDHILVVYSDRIQAWSAGQHRIRLGEVVVGERDRQAEGAYIACSWQQGRRRLALLTDASFLHIYGVSSSREVLWQSKGGPPAKQVTVYIQQSARIALEDSNRPVAIFSDHKTILVVTAAGTLLAYDWNGREKAAPSSPLLPPSSPAPPVEHLEIVPEAEDAQAASSPGGLQVVAAAHASRLGFLAFILSDGRAWLVQLSEEVLSAVDLASSVGCIHQPIAGPSSAFAGPTGATCAAFDPVNGVLALGCADGAVLLYDPVELLDARPDGGSVPALRSLSQEEWGIDPRQTLGAVACLRWTADGDALAVGHATAGVAVWSAGGCRLLSTVSASAPAGADAADAAKPPLEGPITGVCWSSCGYRLMAVPATTPGQLQELRFGRPVLGDTRSPLRPRWGPGQDLFDPATSGGLPPWMVSLGGGGDAHYLLAAEQVLLVRPRQAGGAQGAAAQGASEPELSLQYLRPPQAYIDAAYPLTMASRSLATGDIAIAGAVGVAVWLSTSGQWRLMGDAAQERSTHAAALVWLPGAVVGLVASVAPRARPGAAAPGPFRMLLYPRAHLDQSSVIATLDLGPAPITAADALGECVLLASGAVEFRLARYVPAGAGPAQLTLTRHLVLLDSVSPLQEMALVDPGLWGASEEGEEEEVIGADGSSAPDRTQTAESTEVSSPAPVSPAVATDEQGMPVLRVRLPSPAPARSAPRPPRRRPSRAAADRAAPWQAVLRRQDGALSLLDLDMGSEKHLARGVERFWLPALVRDGAPTAGTSLIEPGAAQAAAAAASFPPHSGTPAHSRSSSSASLGDAQLELRRQRTGFAHSRTTSGADVLSVGLDASYVSLVAAKAAAVTISSAAATASGSSSTARALPAAEFPWWFYGAGGMRLVFPSALLAGGTGDTTPGPGWASGTPGSATGSLVLTPASAPRRSPELDPPEPELAFDAGVYPLGVALADLSLVGLAQRAVHAPAGALEEQAPAALPVCRHPLPGSQPALPCLLRRLLAAGREAEALDLARWYAPVPHFGRSAEWLLFTALENDERDRVARRRLSVDEPESVDRLARNDSESVTLDRPSATLERSSSSVVPLSARRGRSRCGPALRATVALLAAFPRMYARTIVSVARKTDAALWPALFAAAGSPYRLALRLLAEGEPEAAAAALLLVNHVEGPGTARNAAVAVARAALEQRRYALAVRAVRFLTPPGEERLLPAVGLVGRRGTAGILAARRQSSGEAPQAGAAVGGEPASGLGSWIRSWWGEAAPSAVESAPPTPRPPRHESSEAEVLDSLTPLVDVWGLLSAHAWALLGAGGLRAKPSGEAVASLARLADALRALPGTELRELLVVGAREAGQAVDPAALDATVEAVARFRRSTVDVGVTTMDA